MAATELSASRAALDTLLAHVNRGRHGFPFADFRVLAQNAEIDGLLQAASKPGVVRNHLANMLNGAACSTDSSTPDAVFLSRLEAHALLSESNMAAFRAAADEELIAGLFYSLEEESFIDFDHFDSVLSRIVALLGTTHMGPGAVGGLEPAEYWAHIVAMAVPVRDDDNVQVPLSTSKPWFWAACVERALDSGLTADSLVYQQGEWPNVNPKAGYRPLLDCIAEHAGAGCAAIFRSIVQRRAMSARIGSNAAPHNEPGFRRRLVRI
jgi:hypothetical protein